MVFDSKLEQQDNVSGTFNNAARDPDPPRDRILIMNLTVSTAAEREAIKDRLAEEHGLRRGKKKDDAEIDDLYKEHLEKIKYRDRLETALFGRGETPPNAEEFNAIIKELEAEYPDKTLVYDAIQITKRNVSANDDNVKTRSLSQKELEGFDFTGSIEFVNLSIARNIMTEATLNTQTFHLGTNVPDEKLEGKPPCALSRCVLNNPTIISQDMPPSTEGHIMMDVRALRGSQRRMLDGNPAFITREQLVNDINDGSNHDGMVTNTSEYRPREEYTFTQNTPQPNSESDDPTVLNRETRKDLIVHMHDTVIINGTLPDQPTEDGVIDPLDNVILLTAESDRQAGLAIKALDPISAQAEKENTRFNPTATGCMAAFRNDKRGLGTTTAKNAKAARKAGYHKN